MSITHPNSGLREVGPHGDLLAGGHIRIPIPAECVLQFLQLLRGEVGSLAPLAFVFLVILWLLATGGHWFVMPGAGYVLRLDGGLVYTAIAWTDEKQTLKSAYRSMGLSITTSACIFLRVDIVG